MEIIVPASGLSTRFANMKPKYLLCDHRGHLMLENALRPYLDRFPITIGILKEHDIAFNASACIYQRLPQIKIVKLAKRTKGPADTVNQIIEMAHIHPSQRILIKDCDSFFYHEISHGNLVYVSHAYPHLTIEKLKQKSFVVLRNDQIHEIIEKQIKSSIFCVGGYQFESVLLFQKSFQNILCKNEEIFVSHVIQESILQGSSFFARSVRDYIDVGTKEEWGDYTGYQL